MPCKKTLSRLFTPQAEPPALDRGNSMPCSAQLFDLLKFVAGGGGAPADLTMADLSDEDEAAAHTDSSASDADPSGMPDTSASVTPDKSSTEAHDDLRRTWADETMRNNRERDTMSSRFTALSLNNLSASMSTEHVNKNHPPLPFATMDDSPELAAPIAPPPLSRSQSSFSTSSASSEEAPDVDELANVGTTFDGDREISPEEKLAAIVNEFGDVSSIYEGDEPERILAESKGSLFKSVMVVGNLHLTTHRLLFHAYLPPDNETWSNLSAQQTADVTNDAVSHQPDLLHSGPVTIHRPGPIRTSRRVWMELSSEMVTTFPSADEAGRVRPLRCVLLSSIKKCDPLDPDHPCDFYVTYDTPSGPRQSHFTVDTEQSAIQWRRALDAAIFRQIRHKWRQIAPSTNFPDSSDWSVIRICIPFDRVTLRGVNSFHSFATLVGMDIAMDGVRISKAMLPVVKGDWSTEDPVGSEGHKPLLSPSLIRTQKTGSFLHRRSLSLGRRPQSPARSDVPKSSDAAVYDSLETLGLQSSDQGTISFNIGVLNEQAWFAQAIRSAVHASQGRKCKPAMKRPKLVWEVGGHDCLATDEELDAEKAQSGSMDSEEAEEDDDDGGLVQETRKKEKALMAAKVFGLKEEEGIWIKRCYVATALIPARGHIIVTPRYICFWRRVTVGSDIKYRFPIEDVKGAATAPSLRTRFHGLALQVHGYKDVRFEFWNKEARDEVSLQNDLNSYEADDEQVILRVNATCATRGRGHRRDYSPSHQDSQSQPATPVSFEGIERVASPVGDPLLEHPADILVPPKDLLIKPVPMNDEVISYMPFVANRPPGLTSIKPRTFTCLTIGSRGDVQPYIALGLRLMKDGHKVVIVTHGEFKEWVEGYGIEHRQAGGDPTALMKLSQEHRMFSPGFFKESLGAFRQWLDDLLLDSWNACHDADVLIESPSAMAGIHIAEALKIPYFRAFTMPWTRTAAYPQAFLVPAFEMGPSFNYSTYVLYDNIIWKATAPQINRWRKKHLGIKGTDMAALSVTKVPFLYNFSSSVVPKPLDWHDDIMITGYWSLEDSDSDWSPPAKLDEFIAKAKEDGKPLVYIGFGSIVVPRPNAMTKSIIKAVEKADVRAIIAKGWSSRGGDPATEGEHIEFPASCYGVDKIPHAWLFPRVQAALHHGGAGTVGASLRAGIPTLIKPWFGDQFFWSIRVTKLGVGLKVASLHADDIASALTKATSDKVMIEKAARIGERIRSENGVDTAVKAISDNIIRAGGDRRKMQWAK
ncbi:hypothetical protein L198_07072 [Cryptococcus wingfieldii CBS 7118]|uniref:sterol 3beta-glucosyltransferase n=1 Tax=Cryptococcus wingfieldii CBS 7118 TaxID=1295528 RepID=A0A1E3IG96_9TREE|nr:hypothetical protein L198_07072 [Cryptococcus wingfieldii CBS 7118]ODN87445.1 hypothetical protein L198_07072 [Cryptococcus wingfieldii CBS 7118]